MFIAFDLDLSETETNIINAAYKLDKQKFNEVLKENLLSVSQKLMYDFVVKSLNKEKECNNKDDLKERTEIFGVQKETKRSDSIVDRLKNVTYIYVEKDWQRKIIDFIVESSKQNKKVTLNEIFKNVGISTDVENGFRKKLGKFLKKSGINCKKLMPMVCFSLIILFKNC